MDASEESTVLVIGRPFAMVEGRGSMATLQSPLDGEVVAVNAELLRSPEVLDKMAEDPSSWIVKVEHHVNELD